MNTYRPALISQRLIIFSSKLNSNLKLRSRTHELQLRISFRILQVHEFFRAVLSKKRPRSYCHHRRHLYRGIRLWTSTQCIIIMSCSLFLMDMTCQEILQLYLPLPREEVQVYKFPILRRKIVDY